MLFSVRGKFANNYTFTVNPVDAATPHEALATVVGSDDIKNYGQPVTMVTVKALSGKNRKIKISDKPAAERKGGGRKKKAETTATQSPPASSGKRNR